MGLGGALIMTAVARNIRERQGRRMVLISHNRWQDLLRLRFAPDSEVYRGNDDIAFFLDDRFAAFILPFLPRDKFTVVDINDPEGRYWVSDHPDRVIYKTGHHAIEYACARIGIEGPDLRPKILLSREEEFRAKEVLDRAGLVPGGYIVLEPQARFSFSGNKAWFPERWQKLADNLPELFFSLGRDMKVVQVGRRGDSLRGVTDLTGKTTFREAAAVLRDSAGYVGYIGGLVHLARAVECRSVVLVSGFDPLHLAVYPQDIALYRPLPCSGCGLKTPCPYDRECMRRISVDDVLSAVRTLLKENCG